MRLVKTISTAVAAVGIACGSYPAYCGLLIWSGNHHTIAEGQLYRSAQLTGQEFGEEIDTHHIRTVLNLRGPYPTDGWYQEEIAATRAHGATHYDIGILAQELDAEGVSYSVLITDIKLTGEIFRLPHDVWQLAGV